MRARYDFYTAKASVSLGVGWTSACVLDFSAQGFSATVALPIHTISGSLAMAAATRRASSRLSNFTIDRRPGSSS